MFQYNCLNPIAAVGLEHFDDQYTKVDDITNAQAVLVRSAAMHDMELSDSLVAIARAGAGVNNIPLEKCAEKGIVVFNTPGANANAVKELVIAGMFMAARDIVGGVNWVQSVKDQDGIAKMVEKEKGRFAGKEIQGKKLGVIGLGAIGVLVANAANRLGMKVYGCDPFISVEHAWNLSRDIIHVKEREEIFRECDYITVHVPLMDDTKGMFNETSFEMMKDGVVILNFSRDLLVNDEDMEKALQSGKVSKYVTDFPNQKTASMEGVIAIPHLGASTEESEDNCAVMAVKQLRDYLENGNIVNSVNYPRCDAGICTTEGRIAIHHKNVPKMISRLTNIISEADINIQNMLNKSKGDFAYSIFDIEAKASDSLLEKLMSLDGVLKVRAII